MDERTPTSRRAYLAAVGAAATLAGCGGTESTPTPSDEPTGTPTDSSTATESPTESPTEPPTDEPTETPVTELVFDGGGTSAFAETLDELREGPADTLRFAPGTYRFDASEAPDYEYPFDTYRVHFDGRGLGDVTIAGPGPDEGEATVVLGDPTRGFLLFDGGTPTVRDLTVRHDPWPMTQGTIREFDDERTVTLELDSGYPTFDDSPFVADRAPDEVAASVFEPDGRRVRGVTGSERGNYKRVADTEAVGGRRYRVTFEGGVEMGGIETGHRLAVVARLVGGNTFVCVDCVRPELDRIRLRSAPGFACWFVACDRPVVTDCTLAPAEGSDRLVSVNADGIHCDNGPGGPRVEGCLIERAGDDAVVADDELLVVDSFESDRTVRVRGTFGSRVGGGDELTVASPALELLEELFGDLPPVAEVDERGGGVTTDVVNPETITFESGVRERLRVGDLLTGPRMRNADTLVRGNTVREIRARFVRIGGADGVRILDNEFVGTHSDGVEVEAVGGDGAGFPKGWSTDVEIRGNRIVDAGLVGVPAGVPHGVFVGADTGEAGPSERAVSGRPHSNVTVAENEVVGAGGPGIAVHDASDVTLRSNRIEDPGRLPGPDWAAYGVGCWNLGSVTVEGTTVEAGAGLNGYGWRRDANPTLAGNTYVVEGERRAATFTDLG